MLNATELLAECEAARPVDAGAEPRIDDGLPTPALIEEPRGDDGGVGAEMSVLRPSRMADQPSRCGSVSVPKPLVNHWSTSGWAQGEAPRAADPAGAAIGLVEEPAMLVQF
jgi:hypothetical protein